MSYDEAGHDCRQGSSTGDEHDIYTEILRKYWGYPSFRGVQREIIESISQNRDTLGLMPTGGGKSITFQVPALAHKGVCIVITPLIALMKDQVHQLRQRSILAAAIFSGMTHREIMTVLDNCILGNTKLLYVSPERLTSELFQTKLRRINVSLITVDEAHCISQWGYDFRPSYLKIADIRLLKPGVPVLALTASATERVAADIQERLLFRAGNVVRMSFERKNLTYVVRHCSDKNEQTLNILRNVPGCSIVYVRTRKRAGEVSDYLNSHGVKATFFHAGLEHGLKDVRQKDWTEGRIRVIVATNAFGMGIDKPDVRTVIHVDSPSSPESYFQEAGRAGRDGLRSYAVLLYDGNDERKLLRRIGDEFPPKKYIFEVYSYLASYYQIASGSGGGHTFTFDIQKFCQTFKLFPVQTHSALKILERAGYIEYNTEPDDSARLKFLLKRDELCLLDRLAPLEEKLVTALLRRYGSLFTDYCNISDNILSDDTGIPRQDIYTLLKGLGKRHIVHFIPQRKIPCITYTRDREEPSRMALSKEVYEERRQQLVERINAMIAYANNSDVCRSRQLLRYFGDTESKDCGHCDVCLSHKAISHDEDKETIACKKILALLADGGRHHITQTRELGLPQAMLTKAMQRLISEEKIGKDNCYIFVRK